MSFQREPDAVERARALVLRKMYVSNVGNRLREMEFPSTIDMKRWVWELMQNAKDSIAGTDQKSVDIQLIKNEKEVIFIHNGAPFTGDSFLALLYKYSDGKQNSAESTGRFGTGFLTTHCLSKIVRVEGDIFMNDSGKKGAFDVTMYRDGDTNEKLLVGIDRMEREKKYFDTPFGYTKYTYILRTPKNKEASEYGFNNFQSNIAPTMLFNSKFGNVVFFSENGIQTKINRTASVNFGDVSIETFHVYGEDDVYLNFIYCQIKQHSDELSERFGQERDVRIAGTVMLTSDKHLTFDENVPCLFCSLPLVGSESHIMPFIINSDDFEPNTERQGILLNGNEKIENCDILSDVGINKLILRHSITQIFEKIVKHCSEQNYKDLHILSHGLKEMPNVDRDFDGKWYYKNMMLPCRNVLKKYPLINTKNGMKKLNEVFFPLYEKNDNKYKEEFYKYVEHLFGILPVFEESIAWSRYIWVDDKEIKVINISKLFEKFCSNETKMDIEFINSFISFAWEYHQNLLRMYPVLINDNKEHIYYSDNIALSVGVSKSVIDCIEELGEGWRMNHLWSEINSIVLPLKHNKEYAMTRIKELIKNNSSIYKCLILTKYIINGNTKRQKMFDFASQMFRSEKIIFTAVYVEKGEIDEDVYNDSDKHLFDDMISKIHDWYRKDNSVVSNFKDLIEFIYSNVEHYKFNQYAIVPNQNGEFKYINQLYSAPKIPKILIDAVRDKLWIDSYKFLIDQTIKIDVKEFSILDITKMINDNIENYYKNQSKLFYYNNKFNVKSEHLDFAKIVVCMYTSKDKDREKIQTSLMEPLSNFDGKEYAHIEAETCSDLYKYVNPFIIDYIQDRIEKCKDLSNLSKYFKNPIEFLDSHYNIFNTKKFNIIPNQNGVFVNEDQLFLDGGIYDELKGIIKPYDDVIGTLMHKEIKNIKLNKFVTNESIVKKLNSLQEGTFTDKNNKLIFVDKDKLAVKILGIIPNKNPENQQNLIDLYNKTIGKISQIKPKTLELPSDFWKIANDIVLKQINSFLKAKKELRNIDNDEQKAIDILNSFYSLYKNPTFVPNQKGRFCEIKNVKEDKEIPDNLKDFVQNELGYKIRDELKHKSINLRLDIQESVDDVGKIIIEKFKCLNDDKKVELSESLLQFIPEKEDSNVIKFVDNYKIIMNIKFKSSKINTSNESIWDKAQQILCEHICDKLEQDKNIEITIERTRKSKEEIINLLNYYYSRISNSSRKIFPNQLGEYCKRIDLFESELDETIKDILAEIEPEKDFRRILVDTGIQQEFPKKELKDISKEIDEQIKINIKFINKLGIKEQTDKKEQTKTELKEQTDEKEKTKTELKEQTDEKEKTKIDEKTKRIRNSCTMLSMWLENKDNREKTEGYFKYFNEHRNDIFIYYVLPEKYGKKLTQMIKENPSIASSNLMKMVQDEEWKDSLMKTANTNSNTSTSISTSSIQYPILRRNTKSSFRVEYVLSHLEPVFDNRDKYLGEAAVYEALLKSGKYSYVKWQALSQSKTEDFILSSQGNKYYINTNVTDHTIFAIRDGKEYQFIVLAEDFSYHSDKIEIVIDSEQFDMLSDKAPDIRTIFVLVKVGSGKRSKVIFLNGEEIFNNFH